MAAATATTMQRTCSNAAIKLGGQQPAAAGVAPPSALAAGRSRRQAVMPQALFLQPYGGRPASACLPAARLVRAPSLGLGLSRTFDMLDLLMAADWPADWFHDTDLSMSLDVHPMDVRTLQVRYQLQSNCPGMAPEDIRLEISPDRVLTVAGSRKTSASRKAPPAAAPASEHTAAQDKAPAAAAASAAASAAAAPDASAQELPSAGQPAAAPPSAPTQAATAAEAAATTTAAAASEELPADEGVSSRHVIYRFRRSFVLPEDADVEAVTAALDKGVLTVTVPRKAREDPKPRRRITVSAA